MLLHTLLATGEIKAVLPCNLLTDACAAYPFVPVTDCPAVVDNAVERYMHMRMLLVEVAYDENLRVGYSHFLQVFQRYSSHCAVGQAVFILLMESQRDVSDRLRNLWIHF